MGFGAVAGLATLITTLAVQEQAMSEQQEASEKQIKIQTDAQDKLFSEQKKQQEDLERRQSEEEELQTSTQNRQSQRSRQRARAAGAQGRSDTILTSPLGVVGDAPVTGKTLLGT